MTDRSNKGRPPVDGGPTAAAESAATAFHSLIESSFEFVKILDAEGRILYASPSAEWFIGYSPEELVGRHVFDFVYEEDRERAMKAFQRVLKDGEAEHMEVREKHRDGRLLWIECAARNHLDHPAIAGIVINCTDIHARKRAETALRRSEERYQKAFSASPDSITLTDWKTNTILEANDGFERITGYRREEVIGRSVPEIGIWKNPEQRRRFKDALEHDGRVRDYEMEVVTKSGDVRLCLVSSEMIEVSGERCFVGVTRDITERKRAETELARKTQELQQEHGELKEKNIALKQVLEHIEKDKRAYRRDVAAQVRDLVAPVITRLRARNGQLTLRDIDRLEAGLRSLADLDASDFEANLSKLTARELDICEMIREGLSSKEIADSLGLSPQTVLKHRQSIRRKLQLSNKDINLATFLRSQ